MNDDLIDAFARCRSAPCLISRAVREEEGSLRTEYGTLVLCDGAGKEHVFDPPLLLWPGIPIRTEAKLIGVKLTVAECLNYFRTRGDTDMPGGMAFVESRSNPLTLPTE